MKAKLLTLAGLCALAAALAVPASGATVSVYPFHDTETNPSFQVCGLDLQAVFTESGAVVVQSSGATLMPNEFRAVWTNPATGKSIVIQAGQLGTTSAPIDNGDGTVSFIFSASGNYIVKDAHGAPISLDAFKWVDRVTFDATTWELLSVEHISFAGNGSDIPADNSCDTIVPALT